MTPARKRLGQLLMLGVALAAFFALSRQWPKDQVVRFNLGDAASRVEELRVRYGEGASPDEWTRTADFGFAQGKAPRIVTHETRLPDGDYTIEVEVFAAGRSKVVTRRAPLTSGGTTTVDVSREAPAAATSP